MNKKDTISFADIETTAFSEVFDSERIEQLEFKLGCIITYDLNYVELERKHYTDLSEFCIKLNSLNIVYFHNLGFDIKFIQKELLSLNTKYTPIIAGSSFLCAKFFKFKRKREAKTVEIRDSLALLKRSVKILGNNINLPKLQIVDDNYANIAYCFRDCEIVAFSFFKLIDWLRDFFNFEVKTTRVPLTIASLAKKVFCTIYPNAFYRHDFKIYDKSREYYYGGRTEVFNFNKLKNGVIMDVVSLYPSMCTKYKLPNSYTTWWEINNKDITIKDIIKLHKQTKQNDYIIGFECLIKEKQFIPLYPTRIDEKVAFINGIKKVFMTIYEYEYLKKKNFLNNKIRILKVLGIARANEISTFKDYFIPLADKKQDTDNKFEREFTKFFMNTITGKFGQKPERKKIEYFNEADIKENQDFYYDIDLECSYNEKKTIQKYQTTNLLTIICITNLARFTLWKQIIKLYNHNKEIYYCDTDSIAVNKDSLELFDIGNQLGQWSIQNEVKEYQAIDSKEYIFIDKKDKSTIKFKGLITKHLKVSDFYDHYKFGTITRIIPKNKYCDTRKIPHESVVFLKKEKRNFYFKRLITNELKTIPLIDCNLSISTVKKHNRNIIYNNILLPNIMTTQKYKKWIIQEKKELKLENKLTDIANTLNINYNKIKLIEIRDIYDTLKGTENELKRIMFKVYNDFYSHPISSYTTKFYDFYNGGYIALLNSKIQSERNKIKRMNKDPKKQQIALNKYYSLESVNLRILTIRKMLVKQDYTVITDFDIENLLNAYPKWKNHDIINELITQYNEGGLIDSDIVEIDELYEREAKQLEIMREFYEKIKQN